MSEDSERPPRVYTDEEREALRLPDARPDARDPVVPGAPAPPGLLASWRAVVQGRLPDLAAAVAVYALPGMALSMALLAALPEPVADGPAPPSAALIVLALSILVGVVFLLASAAGLYTLIGGAGDRRPLGWREAARAAPRRLVPLLLNVLALTAGAVVIVLPLGLLLVAPGDGALLFVVAVPILLVYARLLAMQPVIVAEGRGPIAAFGRSWRLVEGRTWRVAGLVLLLLAVAQTVSLFAALPGLAGGRVPLGVTMVTEAILAFAGLLGTLSLAAAVYTDGVERHGPRDQRLDLPPSAGPGSTHAS